MSKEPSFCNLIKSQLRDNFLSVSLSMKNDNQDFHFHSNSNSIVVSKMNIALNIAVPKDVLLFETKYSTVFIVEREGRDSSLMRLIASFS